MICAHLVGVTGHRSADLVLQRAERCLCHWQDIGFTCIYYGAYEYSEPKETSRACRRIHKVAQPLNESFLQVSPVIINRLFGFQFAPQPGSQIIKQLVNCIGLLFAIRWGDDALQPRRSQEASKETILDAAHLVAGGRRCKVQDFFNSVGVTNQLEKLNILRNQVKDKFNTGKAAWSKAL